MTCPCPPKPACLAPCGRLSGGHLLLKSSHWPGRLWLSHLSATFVLVQHISAFFLSQTQQNLGSKLASPCFAVGRPLEAAFRWAQESDPHLQPEPGPGLGVPPRRRLSLGACLQLPEGELPHWSNRMFSKLELERE